jgi:chorismate synthase
MALRYLTAGESHGRALVGIIEGVPAGLALAAEDIDTELKRRQCGYGRGGRMKIESDHVQILSGVRWGRTLGSPIALVIENRDWKNWEKGMSAEAADEGSIEPVTRPRPGHADLSGALKYGHKDIRNILERSSARETAMRVALGAVARKLLKELGIRAGSFVEEVGHVAFEPKATAARELHDLDEQAAGSAMRCPDSVVTDKMIRLVDSATEKGDSLGGVFTVFMTGLPPGLGSHVQWDRRLDGRLAQAMMSIQAMKGVEVGLGFRAARSMGSEVMAAYERSDICAVPAASVIGEAMASLVVADAIIEKFGGDSIVETKRNLEAYLEGLGEFS